MPRRLKASRRWLTAAGWPVGVAVTSWDYMWRSTPMHRRETIITGPAADHRPPELPVDFDSRHVLSAGDGHGPLFHRCYRVRIREPQISAADLVARIKADPNQAAPTKLARFFKVLGDEGTLEVGDEYVVRMPGPWDGPVRVIAAEPSSFRLTTLKGHLEAGQIEFRANDRDGLVFEIESWARSSDWLSNLLYHHVRMAKEVQLHMWISFLEGVVTLSGGRMTGGVDIETRRVETAPDGR